MAPQKELEELLIPEQGRTDYYQSVADPDIDGSQVVILTPTQNGPDSGDKSKGLKTGKQELGLEIPRNCPHLETALFFFGIAGMIVSLIMLIFHLLRKVPSYC